MLGFGTTHNEVFVSTAMKLTHAYTVLAHSGQVGQEWLYWEINVLRTTVLHKRYCFTNFCVATHWSRVALRQNQSWQL